MNRLIVGAPFGNYLRWPGVTSTLGTFTVNRRAGWLGRLWRVLRTVRCWPRVGAWVNKLGLPNPGIDSLRPGHYSGDIISVHGFDTVEWNRLALKLLDSRFRPGAVELNLSCPNVEHSHLVRDVETAVGLIGGAAKVVAKLPPVRWMELAVPLYSLGVRHFHLCNTIPTPGGGMSGKPLKQFSLWAVRECRQKWGDGVVLVGGGGVTELADVAEYVEAGADHVAVASMLFNPLNWRKVPVFRDWLNTRPGD